jgi:hypothetical protein
MSLIWSFNNILIILYIINYVLDRKLVYTLLNMYKTTGMSHKKNWKKVYSVSADRKQKFKTRENSLFVQNSPQLL